jgi:hypothetical protein
LTGAARCSTRFAQLFLQQLVRPRKDEPDSLAEDTRSGSRVAGARLHHELAPLFFHRVCVRVYSMNRRRSHLLHEPEPQLFAKHCAQLLCALGRR